MIRLQDSTPAVYYNESRDFQLIGRLYDLVLNAVKTDADIISSLPSGDNLPDSLLDLYAMTLGLKLRTSRYTSAHLRAVCKVFPELLRTKGSIHSIRVLCNALLAAEGISEKIDVSIDGYTMRLSIPGRYLYTALLEDILNYILPAGMDYVLIRNVDFDTPASTELEFSDSVKYNARAHDREATSLFDGKNVLEKDAALDNTLFTHLDTASKAIKGPQSGLSASTSLFDPRDKESTEDKNA